MRTAHQLGKYLSMCIVLSTLLLFSSCTSELSSNPLPSSSDAASSSSPPFHIGLIIPLTGPGTDIGHLYLEGAQLAVDDLNAKNILGRSIELVVEDTGSEPKNAVTAMEKFINVDGITYFAGITSSHALALKPVAMRNGVLLFADATHPNVTGGSDLIFRHAHTADKEAALMVSHAKSLGLKSVGVIHASDDYGMAVKDLILRFSATEAMSAKTEMFDIKGTDFRSNILKVSDSDGIVVIGFGPGFNLVLRQIKESGYKGTVIASQGFALSKAADLGQVVDGIYYTDTNMVNDAYLTAFRKKFNKDPPSYSPVAYGSMELLVNAIHTAEQENKGNPASPEDVSVAIHRFKPFHGTYETMTINEKGDISVPLIMKQFHAS